jgi:hypothetical protein
LNSILSGFEKPERLDLIAPRFDLTDLKGISLIKLVSGLNYLVTNWLSDWCCGTIFFSESFLDFIFLDKLRDSRPPLKLLELKLSMTES